MPSLSDFGLGPEAPESERRRARRYTDDESGARPLPTDADETDPYDAPNDRVDLPGVSRTDAALYFGIGAGLGVAALAIGAALYFGGYLDSPELGPAPATTALEPDVRLALLEEANADEALAFARVADAKLAAAPVFALPPAVESPDIRVTEEQSAPPMRSPVPPATSPAPRARQRPSNLTEELEALDRAQPTPMPTPREPPLPPPAQPTAPAETAPPGETSPPQNPY